MHKIILEEHAFSSLALLRFHKDLQPLMLLITVYSVGKFS